MEYKSNYKTWYDLFFKQKTVFVDVLVMSIAVVFLAVLSNLVIPLWPVPITGQTLGIFVIAFFFGSRKGLVTIALYILAGIVGFGVFAQHKFGISAVLGPTGGYIIGFLAMAFFIGLMIEKGHGRTMKSVLLCMVVGEIILYIFGLTGLWIYFGNVGLVKILTMGFFPFIIGDVIKIIAAVGLFPQLWKQGQKYAQANKV